GLPHRRCGLAGPGHEDQVGLGVDCLPGEGGEVAGVHRRQYRDDLSAAFVAGNRRDGIEVVLTELVVLGEHHDGRVLDVADDPLGGHHVLVRLAPGAEGVLVDPGDRVGGRCAGDVQDVVLFGDGSQLDGDTRGDRAGDDLVSLADEVGGQAVGLGGVGRIVVEGDVQFTSVHGTRAIGGV